MSELEFRTYEVRNVNMEERTIEGIAMPWDQTAASLNGFKERFARGAFELKAGMPLRYEHGDTIGKVVEVRDSEEGLVIKGRISETQRGNEVYTLVRDGAISKFSIGFKPIENQLDEDVVVRTKAQLGEVSLVAMPFYDGADVLSVRDANSTETEAAPTGNTQEKEVIELTDNIAPEVAELREAVSVLERNVEVLKAGSNEPTPSPIAEFRSIGEYAKAVAKGDDKALAIYRVYTGGTTSDSVLRDGWAADAIRLVDKGRKAVNAFSKGVLPSEGTNVEYGVLGTNTMSVAVQAAQGDTLASGKVAVTSEAAPVKTYGGYTTLSRQEIERASVNILDIAFKGMAIEYAKATEAAVRGVVTAATGTGTATLSADSAAGWLGFLADSAGALEDAGLDVDLFYVSADVFKRMAVLVGSDGRPLLSYGAGANTIGSADVANLSASFNGVPVIRDSALAANTCFVASKEAVRTWESAGAPFRLGPDDNITTLTRDYSVYGYLAAAVQIPAGLVKGDVDLV